MAITTLGNMADGSIIKLKENGTLVDFYVAKHDYESDLNGAGRTLVVRKDVYDIRQWNTYIGNHYPTSAIDTWLNSGYKYLLDANIRSLISTTKFYYDDLTTGESIYKPLERAVFLLSLKEAGGAYNSDGSILPISSTLKIAYLNGKATSQWTRSPWVSNGQTAWFLDSDGESQHHVTDLTYGSRPAFTLSSDLYVNDDGSVFQNTAPTTPSSISVPSNIYGGQLCSVSWSKSTDEDGNLEGYIVERSYNGGSSWSQIYQGTATSTSTTVPFGTSTVMFRVCAYDTEGEKSGWRTSSNKTVVNNRAPGAPPSISVPLAPSGGEALTVTWTAASDADGNLEGYELERQWDGTGAFTQLYKGAVLSYRDSIPKGEHTSVIYRVRSYDAMGAKSSYTTSPSRTIENNTAPVIISDLSGDLGVKSDGFTIPYTITDAEQQAVTVTEAVGSLIKRSYQPTLGEQNTFEVTGEYFQKILNGANTVTITAQDTGGKSSVLSLTFTKKVHKAVITLTEPLPSEQQIEVCVLSITGEIPADADCLIEVTNNGADEEPVWEDATADVKAGRNHVFANKTQTNGWAFNFRVTAERGQDGESENGGYIMSIQGGFQ